MVEKYLTCLYEKMRWEWWEGRHRGVAWSCSVRVTRPVQGLSSLEALLIRLFCVHISSWPMQGLSKFTSSPVRVLASRGRVDDDLRLVPALIQDSLLSDKRRNCFPCRLSGRSSGVIR